MTTIGLVGAGRIGGTVARLAVDAGYDVVVSNSRGPDTLTELVAELGPRASAATVDEAAEAGDLVVVSIPFGAYPTVPAGALAGKTVVETMNYYPARDGQFPQVDSGGATSSELVQQHLPDSGVVKCFNNIYFRHLLLLARPSGSPERSALPIAGDDARAKAETERFLDAVGYDTVDVGGLADSWRTQPGTPVYGVVYAGGDPNFAASPGVFTSAEVIRGAVADARR